jgi:hypothetical protein
MTEHEWFVMAAIALITIADGFLLGGLTQGWFK